MSKKEEKAKEYVSREIGCKYCAYVGVCKFGKGYDSAELYDCNAEGSAETFEAGWHAAMEYLYKLPLDEVVDEIIRENKND